ncbi:MAG: efflux RND transporter permease subunit [Myxococcales bacterium]|nr:efflux RND transporter permease subunit [Myxococcales bacterium]MBL0195848.1 efflux RND transporter permease subunit [Myxococcales bacterium]HQY61980.1 CusA/CzcA family heavy metal efflux RND transporter [Polyangiaceae bacterium]
MAVLAFIVAFALRNRAVVLLATLLFLAIGLRAATTLPVDAVPDITNVQVQVITASPALGPTEMEKIVTIPVERAMAGIPKTTEVRSISKYGVSVVTVVFQDGTDIYFARQQVNERMREAQEAIPEGYGKPEMGPNSGGLGEIYQFTVENESLTLMEREEVLDWQVAPALRAVPGIVEVNSFGGEDRQYQIELDPGRMQAAGLSTAQVIDALRMANANAGGGYLEANREHVVIGTDGLVRSLDDLRNVVLAATTEGVPITLASVADVHFGARLRRGAASRDGKGETVLGVAMMLLGENSRTVTAAVKAKLAAIEPSLPPGTKLVPFYDRSVLVNRTTGTVGMNLAEGAALVILVLFALLGDLRAGLVVAIVIPLSLLFAIAAMNALGLSGNLMSLGAIDFGLLVDGAVIIVENAERRLSEARRDRGRELTPEERTTVVESATLEVRSASLFGEAILAIVYLPLLTLSGIEGKMFRPMATTVLLALAGAFLLSLTLIPVLASLVLVPRREHKETWLLSRIHATFVPLLGHAFKRRGLAVGFAVAMLGVAVACGSRLGAEFIPQLDEGDLLVEARRLPGAALSETIRTDTELQRALLKIPEVKHAVSRAGAPEIATDPMGLEQSDVYMLLADRSEWRRGLTREDLAKQVSETVERETPEVAGGVSQPIQMRTNELVAGVRSDVALLLYGTDLDELARLGDVAAKTIRRVPGAADVRVEQVAGLRYLRIVPDRRKLARYGLTVQDVNQLTETLSVGLSVGQVLEGERRFSMVVKTRHAYDGDAAPLRTLPLRTVSGQVVPLGDVADIVFVTGPAQVSRASQSRRLTVEFNVRGRDLTTVVNEARAAVERAQKLPVGYRAEWGGQFEHYEEARGRLMIVVPIALGLIGFLLWLAFRSARLAALMFSNVPFATVGGVVALAVRGIPFSISAGVGFIALFGVAVLNGLVLVSFARDLEAAGSTHLGAIREATELRLRPVLTTALVASLGFVPMALSTAPGSEVQRPLATVVIGGLLSATVLTLIVLPVVYAWLAPDVAHGTPSLRPPPSFRVRGEA